MKDMTKLLATAITLATGPVFAAPSVAILKNPIEQTINDFSMPAGAGVLDDTADSIEQVSMFPRCADGTTSLSCLNTLGQNWFTGCVITSATQISTSKPSHVSISMKVGGEFLFRASPVDAANSMTAFRVEVDYSVNNTPTTISEDVKAVMFDQRYFLAGSQNNVVYVGSSSDSVPIAFQTLGGFDVPGGPIQNLTVSICDIAPGIFDLNQLTIDTHSI